MSLRRLAAITFALLAGIACSSPSATVAMRPPEPQPQPRTSADAAAPGVPSSEELRFGEVGSTPAGWQPVDGTSGAIEILAGDGATILQLTPVQDSPSRIGHVLDVGRYRGKRVVITTRARFTTTDSFGAGMIGIDLVRSGAAGLPDRRRGSRIEQETWAEASAVIDVPADATAATLVLATTRGSFAVGPITLEILGPMGAGDQAPAALEGRALENVIAFARLYGAVRYFHPSDEAAALTDAAWSRFVRDGVERVEGAADPAALAAALTELFAPLAPTAQIYADHAPLAEVASSPPADARPIAWKHVGLGLSPRSPYRSARSDEATSFANVTTSAPLARLRGARLRVSVRVRAMRASPGADAGLWIQSEGGAEATRLYSEPEMQPDPTDAWTPIVVEGTVPGDASRLSIGVQVIGDAEFAVEGLTVERVDGPSPSRVKLPAWTRGPKLATDWKVASYRGDHDVRPGGTGCDGMRGCLAIAPAAATLEPPWVASLGGGVSARVPLTSWTHEGHTRPAASAPLSPPSTTPMTATDRRTRLADVIIAWNIFQHFFPYFDVSGADWPAELRTALGRAALDPDGLAFLTTLRRLVGALRDGHGGVGYTGETLGGIGPWSWTMAEGALVIERVAPACACDLARGDVVVSIDGVATADAIAALAPVTTVATPQHAAVLIARRLRAGVPGERHELVVKRRDVEHRVPVIFVASEVVRHELAEPRPANGAEVAPGIRYVDAGNCTKEEWDRLLPDLAGARAVLVDMRGYPSDWRANLLGHFTDKPLSSPQWHIPRIARPDRVGMIFDRSHWDVVPALPRLRRGVFLTDGRAVSAAETFMGIVAGHRLGEIVGSPSAGTNGNVNPFDLPGGYSVWWTGMKVLNVDGSRLHGVGIQPTVPIAPTIAGIAAGRDEVLERAIDVARRGR